jgi:(2R)-sulfolactate sulfo-lyase subunit alpha
MATGVLIHEAADDVGVAVRDLEAGEEAGVRTLDGISAGRVAPGENIPLGHKIALRDLPAGHSLVEYGRPIGRTVQPIPRGALVHSHNLKSARWSGDRTSSGSRTAAAVSAPAAAPIWPSREALLIRRRSCMGSPLAGWRSQGTRRSRLLPSSSGIARPSVDR